MIDGTDGSGKATQNARLVDRFKAEGYELETIAFPQYQTVSCGMVENYLSGKYGMKPGDVNAKAASIFYAVDRFDASFKIREWIDAGKIVVADRYVAANMAFQGAKISDPLERRSYLEWNDDLEHGIFGIPRPTLNIVLSVPVHISAKLAAKGAKEKFKVVGKDGKADIHERDLEYMAATFDTYREIATTFPNFAFIDCTHEDELRTIEDIHNEIWSHVQNALNPIEITQKETLTV